MIVHYLYVPSRDAARMLEGELKTRGFKTEERLGGDGINWLVLARQRAAPTEGQMASTRRSLELLAARFDGEYDGWEVDVQGGSASGH